MRTSRNFLDIIVQFANAIINVAEYLFTNTSFLKYLKKLSFLAQFFYH